MLQTLDRANADWRSSVMVVRMSTESAEIATITTKYSTTAKQASTTPKSKEFCKSARVRSGLSVVQHSIATNNEDGRCYNKNQDVSKRQTKRERMNLGQQTPGSGLHQQQLIELEAEQVGEREALFVPCGCLLGGFSFSCSAPVCNCLAINPPPHISGNLMQLLTFKGN